MKTVSAPNARNCRQRATLALLLAGTAAGGLPAPALAQEQQPGPSTQASAEPAPPQDETDIIVTGIRASLQSALGEKRNADNLVEVIRAEQIGKLPDQNLAEVLENVTGVQITRSAGVGTAVQIRGTDANRTEINGVSTVSSGSDRSGISFEDLPAALISSVEVVKVPTASTIEGSVGGTINLRTIRPLSLREPLIAARAQVERSDLSRSTLPRLSATLGNRWDTSIGEIGIVASGSYARQDVASFSPRVDRDAVTLPGSGPSAQAFPFLRIQFFDQALDNFEYETKNATGALEWKPAPNLKFYGDATINNQERGQQSTRVQISGTASTSVVNTTRSTAFETVDLGVLDGPDGPRDLGQVQAALTGTLGVGVEPNGTIDPNLRTSSNNGARITKSRVYDLGAEWTIDRFTAKVQGSLSTSKSRFPNFSTTLDFINPQGPQPSIGRSLDNGVPTAFDLRDGTLQFGIDASSALAPTSAQLLNPANYRLQQVTQGNSSTDNKEKALRADFSYDTSDFAPFLKSFDFGWRWNRTSAVNTVVTNNISYTNVTTAFNRPSGDRFNQILIPGPNNFNAADGRTLYFPDFLIIDGRRAFEDSTGVLNVLNDAITAGNAARATGTAAIPLLTTPTESASGFFTIRETTNAFYAQANIDTTVAGATVRGNAGVRWLRTRLSSIGNNIANNVATGQTVSTSAYEFFLPRFSLVIEPADRVLVRAGVARDIRRPDFNQLSTSVSFGTSANAVVPVGNPELVPESVWSYDLSGEWYFAPSSLISVGFFHKKRTNLFALRQEDPANNVVNGVLNIDITPPCEQGGIYNPIANRNINNPIQGVGICVPISSTFNVGGTTTQTGVELAFQHDLSALESKIGFLSGLGFIGNFTYQKTGGSARDFRAADGPRTIFTLLGFPNSQDRVTLTNLSKISYNTTLFYDKYGLNARVRYTWRSSFISNDPSFFFGLPRVNGARGQLNASINYDVTDFINIGVEGINLLRGDQNQYCINDKALLCFQGLTDRRLTAGVSVRF